MGDSEKENDINSISVQKEILNELKKNNELLESLLRIQANIKARQQKFWFMAIAQVAILVIMVLWWGSKYGF